MEMRNRDIGQDVPLRYEFLAFVRTGLGITQEAWPHVVIMFLKFAFEHNSNGSKVAPLTQWLPK